ncbi:MAG: YkgJ family cysteine cluster protein [Bacteroidota bacterium]
MTPEIKKILIEANNNLPTSRRIIRSLKKINPRKLDDAFHRLHDEVFREIDCLDCANCCSSISPTLYHKDTDRLASALRMKPGNFHETYLRTDEENDFVFQQTPCPLLMPDNYCMVYENRPKACREYPHTDRKRMHQILALTAKNTAVCPAVYLIVKDFRNYL